MILKMNPYSRITKKHGYSIIEVAISLALLALILSGMLTIFGSGFSAAKKNRDRTVAYNLIKEKMEEKSSTVPWPPASEAIAPVAGFTGFQRQVTVTNPFLGFNGLAFISVTVSWDAGTLSQSADTLQANY